MTLGVSKDQISFAEPIAAKADAPPRPAGADDPAITRAQLQSLADGIDETMDTLQARIVAEVLAETLPLVGAGLSDAARAGEAALEASQRLGTVLSDALDLLAGAASQSASAVEAALNAALSTAGFSGTLLGVTIRGGAVHIEAETRSAGSFLQELASDLGLLELGIETVGSTNVDAAFGFDLDFATGASGFFLDTSASAELSVDLSFGDTSIDPDLSLAGQQFVALDAGSSFTGSVSVDLEASGDRLTLPQIGSATLSAELDGSAEVEISVTAANQGDMTPPIAASFVVDWDFLNAVLDAGDNNIDFGNRPDVRFDTVTMDLGSFMEDFAGPLVEQINKLLDPIRPIIDVLDASIAVLENFPGLDGFFDTTGDGRVTLLDIMKKAIPSLDFTGFEIVVDLAANVADWAAFLDDTGFAEGDLVLGGFDIGSADIRLPGFDLSSVIASFSGLADDLDAVLGGLSGAGWSTTDGGSGDTGADILGSMLDDSVFDLPILTEPDQWMNLLLGAPADLVDIDLPEISIGPDEYLTLFEVPIFLGVSLGVAGFANAVINFDFGFDTRGLLDPDLNAIDGFFIVDDPDNAEILLNSGVELQVALDAIVAEVGGGGNIEGNIELDLNGAVDGKLYYDAFIDALTSNPFAIFDASGSITAGFSAWVDTILGELWRWDSPRITLGNFGFDSPGQVVDLADKSRGTLTLHTGGRADERSFVVPNIDIAEVVTIARAPVEGKIDLTINGYTERYGNISHIVGNGRQLDDSFVLDPTLEISADLLAGEGEDVLSGAALGDTLGGGSGRDAIFGHDGSDSLTGGDGNDYIEGGSGADTIAGGKGLDWASYLNSAKGVTIDLQASSQKRGDARGDVLSDIENIEGSNFDDKIKGSLEDGTLAGRGGNDSLVAGDHLQSLQGGDGDDTLKSASTGDTLAGGEGDDLYIIKDEGIWFNENEYLEIGEESDSGYDWVQALVSVDLRGMDDYIERITLLGSGTDVHANAQDNLITGNDLDNGLYGYAGNDTINALAGKDTVYGYLGDDRLNGGKGGDELRGGDGNDTLNGLGGNDDLYASDGDDILTGGLGNDTLRAGEGADQLLGGFGNDFYKVDDLDVVFDVRRGGIDFVWADTSHELREGQEIEVLSHYSWENLLVAIGLAQVTGNWEALVAVIQFGVTAGTITPGSVETSDLTGNGTAQLLIAEMTDIDVSFENVLEGMGGEDTILGDSGKDIASYERSDAAVQIDLSVNLQTGGHAEGDYLLGFHHLRGSAHDDTLLGEALTAGATLEHPNEIHGREGDDHIEGFGGDDTLRGGEGNDTLLGGTGADRLFGGPGDDSILGDVGSDTLDGGQGRDTLKGGDGDDLYIVTTRDRIVDSDGDDTVIALEDFSLGIGDEIERLEAASGTDDLILFGNTFAQVIIGNRGDNSLHGGAGADTIRGAAGVDTALYTLSLAAVDVDLNRATQTGGHAEGDLLSGIENLGGSAFDDTLIGLSAPESGVSADNVHQGLAGNDWIEDVFGQNTLYGGVGDDTLVGSGELPRLSSQGSLLIGGNGDDSLDAGATTAFGGDTLAGGMGNDTYRVTSAGDHVDENAGGDIPDGGDGGQDTLIVDVESWDMNTPGQADIEDAVLGTGRILLANALDNHVTGNTLDNELTGRGGNDTLLGRQGEDTLYGNAGDDNLNGGLGDDLLIGGNGDDLYIVDSTGDVVQEEDGGGLDVVRASVDHSLTDHVETLVLVDTGDIDGTGNTLDNQITGNEGLNLITGLAGNDTLEGGLGQDTLRGGLGDDLLIDTALGNVLAGGSGNDIFQLSGLGNNTLTGGEGVDRIDLLTDGSTLALTEPRVIDLDLGYALNGGAFEGDWSGIEEIVSWASIEVTLVGNTADNLLQASSQNDSLLGAAGDDTLLGQGGADSLSGGLGADSLTGGAGSDSLVGGAGADLLFGNAANDTLNGGSGDDTLDGGLGDDLLVFADGFGTDEVIGFSSSDDEDIDLSAVTGIRGFTDLVTNHLVDVDGAAQIVVGTNSILLIGVSFEEVGEDLAYSAEDFVF